MVDQIIYIRVPWLQMKEYITTYDRHIPKSAEV